MFRHSVSKSSWVLLLSAGFLFPHAVSATGTDRARSAPVFTFYFENDAFTGTDEHYTNGLKFSWLSADLTDWGQTGWRKNFVEALPFVNRPDTQKNFGVALGQNMYTPRDIHAQVPDPTDRPYAGWTYLEFAFVSKTPTISDTLSIQAGVIGPHSLAEDTQRLVMGDMLLRLAAFDERQAQIHCVCHDRSNGESKFGGMTGADGAG